MLTNGLYLFFLVEIAVQQIQILEELAVGIAIHDAVEVLRFRFQKVLKVDMGMLARVLRVVEAIIVF